MTKKRAKPSLANSLLMRNIQETNKRLNLIDGEEEDLITQDNDDDNIEQKIESQSNQNQNNPPQSSQIEAVTVETSGTNSNQYTDSLTEKKTTEVINTNSTESLKSIVSKKRNNVPVYEEQYWTLNAISKVTDISITQLVREGLQMVIEKYKKDFGTEIKSVQEMQRKIQTTMNANNLK